jgi:hypothetical protein
MKSRIPVQQEPPVLVHRPKWLTEAELMTALVTNANDDAGKEPALDGATLNCV